MLGFEPVARPVLAMLAEPGPPSPTGGLSPSLGERSSIIDRLHFRELRRVARS